METKITNGTQTSGAPFDALKVVEAINSLMPYGGRITHVKFYEDGVYTMCELGGTRQVNTFFTALGFAKRDRRDAHNPHVGRRLAFTRAKGRLLATFKKQMLGLI